jgi:hypothetical protein
MPFAPRRSVCVRKPAAYARRRVALWDRIVRLDFQGQSGYSCLCLPFVEKLSTVTIKRMQSKTNLCEG